MKKLQRQPLSLSFIIIFSALIFSMFTCGLGESKAFALSTSPVQTTAASNSMSSSEVDIKQLKTIPEKNSFALTHFKQNGAHNKFFRFIMAMFGVFVSALSIFIGLKIYKKLVLKNNSKLDIIDYDKNLESPKDFKEAINLFLDKTDK